MPAPPGHDAAEPVRTAVTQAPPEPQPEAVPEIGPDSLIGLDRQAVRELLGPPSFVRREKPTELWRYRDGGCALALFLYAEKSGGVETFRVRHVESWAPGGEQTPPRECLNSLARRARLQPTG